MTTSSWLKFPEYLNSARAVFKLGIKIVILTILYLVCFILAAAVTVMPLLKNHPMAAQSSGAASGLPLVAFLNASTLAYLILRSRWHGWRLTLALAASFYGVFAFLTYIEAAAFPSVMANMPPGFLPASFALGAILAFTFMPLAVLILGKWKQNGEEQSPPPRLIMPIGEWAWKLAVIAVIYVFIYFVFGYYVAWQSPAVRAYYGGEDPGSFVTQVLNTAQATPWFPFFQMFRALVWVVCALPIIRMMKGNVWEAGLAVALLFAIPMNSGNLVSNPIMPDAVRLAHLAEIMPSNFIFGWIVVGLLNWRQPRAESAPLRKGSVST